MTEDEECMEHTPLERMMLGVLAGEKKFVFSLSDLEPEDVDKILYAFLCVHVFGGKVDENTESGESFSAIRRLCQVHQIEPIFENRDYPALRRGKTSGHKIILLPDSGNIEENEKKSLQIIKYFSALEQLAITETIVGLIEKFDVADIIKYVAKYNGNLGQQELAAFRDRMLSRKKTNPKLSSQVGE